MSREYPDWDKAIIRARFPGMTDEIESVLAPWGGPQKRRARRLIEKLGVPDLTGSSVTTPEWVDTPDGQADILSAVTTWLDEFGDYERSINALPTPEVRELFSELKRKERSKSDAKASADDETRFFNDPRADLNEVYWKSLALWSPSEAAAISLGKDPRHVNQQNFLEVTGPSMFQDEFNTRLERIKRALKAKTLKSLEPSVFLAWAEQSRMSIKPSLSGVVLQSEYDLLQIRMAEQERTIAELSSRLDKMQMSVSEMNAKAASSLRRLCLALALKRYLANDGRRIHFQKIADDLAQLPEKLRLGYGPIKDILEEANTELGDPMEEMREARSSDIK